MHYSWSSVLGEPVVELDGSGGVYRAHVYGPGGQLLGLQANDYQFYWVQGDHLGSARRLTNGSGTEEYRAEFDPHGQLLDEWAPDGKLYKNSRKFGYERDWTTKLDNAKARMYASKVGRFIQLWQGWRYYSSIYMHPFRKQLNLLSFLLLTLTVLG